MKKLYITLFTFVLPLFLFSSVNAQDKSPDNKVTVSFTWSKIQSYGSNQLAIWVEDLNGKYICTLFATRFTAKGGYLKRPLSLSEWTTKSDLKNARKPEVDALTGATPSTGKQSFTWNCKDKSGKKITAGTYVIRMEANIHDADKMFFRGEIKIGGNACQTKGFITYSDSKLAGGKVLFSDVLVEYR